MLLCEDLQCPRCGGYVIQKEKTNKASCWHCRAELVRNKSLIEHLVSLYKNCTTCTTCNVCKGPLRFDPDTTTYMCELCDYL